MTNCSQRRGHRNSDTKPNESAGVWIERGQGQALMNKWYRYSRFRGQWEKVGRFRYIIINQRENSRPINLSRNNNVAESG